MRVILVAGGLLALAGLALGASLMPSARVNPVYVSIGAPGVPAVLAQAPAPKAPAAAVATANSIARTAGEQFEVVAPVIPAPAPVRITSRTSVPSPVPAPALRPQVQEPQGRCHGDRRMCPPTPD